MVKTGRPPKKPSEKRDAKHQLRVSLSKSERAAIDNAAQKAFPDLDPARVSARWAREILLKASVEKLDSKQ